MKLIPFQLFIVNDPSVSTKLVRIAQLSIVGISLMFSFLSVANAQAPNTDPAVQSDEKTSTKTGIQECVITLLSGRKVTGELIRQNSLIVVVDIDGIETTFQRDRVAKVTLLPPVEERYKEMRSAIPDDDIESRLTLIEWLRARQAYALAVKELRSVLDIDPNNPRAKLLYTWLTEYDKLGTKNKKTKNKDDSTKIESPASTEPSKSNSDPELNLPSRRPTRPQITPLTPEQINLMRIYEIDLRNPPKLRIDDETLKELIRRQPDEFSANQDERNKIFSLPEIEKLRIIFSLKARDLYSQIQVLEDPTSIKDFKQNVYSDRGWLINACASTRCHGGAEAGRFKLINHRPNSVEALYTNFYIIDNFTMSDGARLINYEDPERSPLLQMGMIEQNSLRPHPEIPANRPGRGFRPIFRSTREIKYKNAMEWIRSMYQPRPDYGFQAQPYTDDTSIHQNTKPSNPSP
ncbi:MAG: hypothetical protein P1U42_10750 [Phycisphaerales bacterium]|nr:hypothetical protein [Phycisphaerales bacterium]